MIRAAAGVLAGYCILVVARIVVAHQYPAVNLLCEIIFAAIGGWIAAMVGKQTIAVAGLSALILLLALSSWLAFNSYSVALPLAGAGAAWGGGWLWMKHHPSSL